MPRPRHYSPTIDRFLICVLYHEARRQKKPMTAVTNGLLQNALRQTESWSQAESAMPLHETPPAYRCQPPPAQAPVHAGVLALRKEHP